MSFFIKNDVRFRLDSEQTISTQNPLGTDRIPNGNWVSARNPISSDQKTWGTEKYCEGGRRQAANKKDAQSVRVFLVRQVGACVLEIGTVSNTYEKHKKKGEVYQVA